MICSFKSSFRRQIIPHIDLDIFSAKKNFHFLKNILVENKQKLGQKRCTANEKEKDALNLKKI